MQLRLVLASLMATLLLTISQAALAQVDVSTTITNDGSLFEYCYVLNNGTANSLLGFELHGLMGLDSLLAPDGWNGIATNEPDGWSVYWLSIDSAFDIASGAASQPFYLRSSFPSGTVEFAALDDNFDVAATGMTTGPVPEPAAGYLALIALTLMARKMCRSTQTSHSESLCR